MSTRAGDSDLAVVDDHDHQGLLGSEADQIGDDLGQLARVRDPQAWGVVLLRHGHSPAR